MHRCTTRTPISALQARHAAGMWSMNPSSLVVHVEGATAGTDPQSGHKRHQEINRLKFLKKWQDVLASEHLRPGTQNISEAAKAHRGPHVLVVDFRVPMWDRDAGSLRMFEIIRSLMRLGYGVTFLPDNGARSEPYTRHLQRLGVEAIYNPGDLAVELAEIGSEAHCRAPLAPPSRKPVAGFRARVRALGRRNLRHGRPALGA